MITPELIERINFLSRKSKTEEGLTESEKEEQAVLRRQYIDAFKTNLKSVLDNVEIVDNNSKKN